MTVLCMNKSTLQFSLKCVIRVFSCSLICVQRAVKLSSCQDPPRLGLERTSTHVSFICRTAESRMKSDSWSKFFATKPIIPNEVE